MIVTLEKNIGKDDRQRVKQLLEHGSHEVSDVTTQHGSYLVTSGPALLDLSKISLTPGVTHVHHENDSVKLVTRAWRNDSTVIDLGDGVKIGGDHFATMAGPCSIENEVQTHAIARELRAHGVRIMRGGVFKPRSSPYAFQGLGIEGLEMFHRAARDNGIKIISEVMEIGQIEPMHDLVDIFQVGARNSQNFNLLKALGKVDKPVLLKRGISGTAQELLQSAEYIFAGGNEKVILCERGVRSFDPAFRNVLDLSVVPFLKGRSHLPVVVDPSHGVGVREFIETMALSSIAAGAHGLLIEVHPTPEKAKSDGQQTLNFAEATRLFRKIPHAVASREFLAAMNEGGSHEYHRSA